MSRLTPGTRVRTPRGPGRITAFRRVRDHVPPHGAVTRGVAYAYVLLDRGGIRLFQARELDALDH